VLHKCIHKNLLICEWENKINHKEY
jgi:hypothetical protein